MCFTIFLSTTCAEDFRLLSSSLYRFEKPDAEKDAEPLSLMHHANKWYLSGRHGGCSCDYRHLMAESTDLGFSPVEDWYPEDAECFESTSAVYELFARVVADGYQLDVLDIWNGADVSMVKSIDVSLGKTPRNSFRFFENYRFELGV